MNAPQLTTEQRARLHARVREVFSNPQTSTLAAIAGGFSDDSGQTRHYRSCASHSGGVCTCQEIRRAAALGMSDEAAPERREMIDAVQPPETVEEVRDRARYLSARLERAETAMRDAARLLGQGGTRTGAIALLLGALQQ